MSAIWPRALAVYDVDGSHPSGSVNPDPSISFQNFPSCAKANAWIGLTLFSVAIIMTDS